MTITNDFQTGAAPFVLEEKLHLQAQEPAGVNAVPTAAYWWGQEVEVCSRHDFPHHEEAGLSFVVYNKGVSASAPWLNEPHQWIVPQAELIVHLSAKQQLTERTSKVLNLLLKLVEYEARRLFIPVVRVEVSGYLDPDEGDQELVLSQWVNLSPRAAFRYWDTLGITIEAWINTLPLELAAVANDKLAVEIRWNDSPV